MVVPLPRRGNARQGASYRRRQATVALLVLSAAVLAGCGEPVTVEDDWELMGLPFRAEIWMSNERDGREALMAMREQSAQIAAAMGFGMEDGLLTDLNARAADEYVTVDDRDFYRVLMLGLDYAQFTRGAYDPTVAPLARLYSRATGRPPTPGEIEIVMDAVGWDKVTVAPEARAVRFRHPAVLLNLDVVTRGFAVDAASRVFARSGTRAGLLRLGGSAVAWRHPPGQEAWAVAVEDPRSSGASLLTLSLTNRSLAAVGPDAASAVEILDPRSGMPASSDLLAVVALADSVADANALATALFVMGSRPAGDLLARMNRSEAVLLSAGNGEPFLLVSASLAGRLELSAELEAEVGGRVRYILPPDAIELELPGS